MNAASPIDFPAVASRLVSRWGARRKHQNTMNEEQEARLLAGATKKPPDA